MHRFTILLAALTLVLVAAGASVVSKEAGLSVPDWPLSYGKVMPEMKDGVFYEHGHRMIGATVGFMTLVLAFWLQFTAQPAWLKRLGWGALAIVIIQGVLGGLTVRYLLPPPISISHATLAQLFFSLTVALAIFTSKSWAAGVVPVPDSGWPSLRFLSWLAPLVVVAQLVLGAAYRHKAAGLIPHIVWAFVVLLIVMMTAVIAMQAATANAQVRKASWWLLSLTTLQVILGIVAYIFRASNTDALRPGASMVAATVTHVAVGALVLAACIALSILLQRHVVSVESESIEPGTHEGISRAH